MSWSISTVLQHEPTPIGLQKDLDALRALPAPGGNDQAPQERDEQISAAKRAVFSILTDNGGKWDNKGRAFDNAEEISVSMSGHANKNHQKDDSWADEFISVSLYVKKYRAI